MRHHSLTHALLPIAVGLLGCKPNFGNPVSLITGPAILAVRGSPAEAAPDDPVSYEVLAVDTEGRVPAPDSPVSLSALWVVCPTPKPPIETNAVSRACLDGVALPGQYGTTPTTFSAPMPSDACALFGPVPPQPKPGEDPIRPRDPDVTNGYYLPVRVSLWLPEGLRRPGMAGEDTLVAFGLERISCGLANARGSLPRLYNQSYTLNQNPRLTGISLTPDAASPPVALRPGEVAHVGQGQTVTLAASWTDDS
ncbi:MAG TPA: hypothetical protein VF518_07080, partial [Polyangia bacterium]